MGWGNPAVGRLTSPFGYRVHPVFSVLGVHAGQDIANRCGTPVHSAADGTVAYVGNSFQGRTGNQVVITHGDGVVTRYGHLLSGSTLVKVGDAVAAGQQVASMGGDAGVDPAGAGISTGCHLHFEVNENNGLTPVDPVQFLALRGVALGVDLPPPPPEPSGPSFVLTAFDRGRIEDVIGTKGRVAAVRQLG